MMRPPRRLRLFAHDTAVLENQGGEVKVGMVAGLGYEAHDGLLLFFSLVLVNFSCWVAEDVGRFWGFYGALGFTSKN